MKTMFKVIVIIAIITVAFAALLKCGLTNLKKADFIQHGVIKTMNIGIDDVAMDHEACVEEAKKIIASKAIEGMSEAAMAKEIYAHIFIHEMINTLPSWIRNTSIVNRVYNSTANGIDLEDFGDTFVRQIAYNAIWKLG